MTFVTAVVLSALRAVIITAVVLSVSRRWSAWLDAASPRLRTLGWGFLLLPGLVPELLLGYAYTPHVAGRPVLAELVCATLLGLRLLSVGVIAWQLTPPSPISDSAWYLRALSPNKMWEDWWRFYWVGPIRRVIPPAAIVGLLAFQEFELAGLFRANSWTDALFTEKQLGRAFTDLVQAALGPAALQVIVIFAAMRCLSAVSMSDGPRLCEPCGRSRCRESWHGSQSPGTQDWYRWFTSPWLWGSVTWIFLIVVPLWSFVGGLPAGFQQLAGQSLRLQGLLRELIGGLSVSITAGCAAWVIAAHRRDWLLTLLCLPGLSGSLVISLGTLTVFQRSWLAGLYNTPAMWILASILFLVPRAVLLRMWLAPGDSTSLALAKILSKSDSAHQRQSGRALVWRLETEPRFLAVCCLVYWSYLELTLAALLAPTGLPSGLVRLYNFLHFGRTAALSAEMTILLGGPLVLAAVVWGLARRGRV